MEKAVYEHGASAIGFIYRSNAKTDLLIFADLFLLYPMRIVLSSTNERLSAENAFLPYIS
jgi:hypothetical protein